MILFPSNKTKEEILDEYAAIHKTKEMERKEYEQLD